MNNFETIEQCEATCDILIQMSQQGVGKPDKLIHKFRLNRFLLRAKNVKAAEEEAKVEMQKKGKLK